jgi:hypothetical protein
MKNPRAPQRPTALVWGGGGPSCIVGNRQQWVNDCPATTGRGARILISEIPEGPGVAEPSLRKSGRWRPANAQLRE